jgi:hypothetical protein
LIGIVATSNNTKVLRIPQEVYQHIIEPFAGHKLGLLETHAFEAFILDRFPAILNVTGSGPKKSLLNLPVLSLVPPKTIMKQDSRKVYLLVSGHISIYAPEDSS